eukprot:TRINITY_DN102_c0_g1_i4.p1 TRINITY_DN102_c0_g1~~TRINITY_DN102_c0_g1_i4.p1  ORF type:complete len:517 (-),score=29.70 TRINITY_DN102_c0_g1_i4:189-1739(-)
MEEAAAASSFTLSLSLSALSFAFAFVLFLFFANVYSNKSKKLPPAPPGLPILGNLLQLDDNPHEHFFHLARRYGPLFALRLGSQLTVVATSPAIAEEILKKQDHVFSGRAWRHAASIHAPNSLGLAQPGDRMRFLRKISNVNLFTPNKLASLQSVRKRQVRKTLGSVLESAVEARAVDIGYSSFGYTVNVIATMVFGEELFGLNSSETQEFNELVREMMAILGLPNIVDYFPVLRFLDPQGLKRRGDKAFGRAYQHLKELVLKRLEQKGDQMKPHNDLLAVLLEQRSQEFDLQKIVGYIIDLFLGGTDTTMSTVTWAMVEMLRNPQVMKKCVDEIDSVIGKDRIVEEDDAKSLPYFNAMLKEVLRLHPPGPFLIPRRATEDSEIAGYLIPKDTQILVNVWGIGRDPSVWEDAEKFEPAGFEGKDLDFKGLHFELLPFGSGRRTCVGMGLGTRMTFHLLASLIQCFDWRLPHGMSGDDIDMSTKFGLTLHRVVPLELIPTPRLPLHVFREASPKNAI